jgi:toxin ParE1/3/4
VWSLEFAADAERDFELIFDHLVKSYLEFSEDNDVAFERAVERIRGIRISANKLALAPKQGTLRPDILESLRFVRLDKAVFWFVLDEGQKIVRVLAVFFGAQDHIRHMLVRLLDDQMP